MSVEKRDRSRSRSFDSSERENLDFPLMLAIPSEKISQFTDPDIINRVKDITRLERIKLNSSLNLPDLSEGILYLYGRGGDNKLAAFDIVISIQLIDELVTELAEISEIKIFIPENMVSLLIGRKGQQIDKLQSMTHTIISVLNKIKGISERMVSVKGKYHDIKDVVRKIFKLIMEKKVSPERVTHIQHSSREKLVAKFVIPSSCAGFLIGKQGVYTKKLKQEYDVDIKIVNNEGPPCKESESLAVSPIYMS